MHYAKKYFKPVKYDSLLIRTLSLATIINYTTDILLCTLHVIIHLLASLDVSHHSGIKVVGLADGHSHPKA